VSSVAIRVSNLSKRFTTPQGVVAAVHDVSFAIEAGEFFTLLGPSGCGKSTTLRCIAGLEQADDGEIVIDDEVVFSRHRNIEVPPHRRPIGMVFQSYAIWPHMTVFDNVAYPLKRSRDKLSKAEIRERVDRALNLVKLEGLANRPAPQLSGGQQQRVALARAIVHEPSALLLDEPLSNLDAKLRDEMRLELKDLARRLRTTCIFVTHDQLEALTMSDRIAVMAGGSVSQIGEPRDLYDSPSSRFSAEFVGVTNFFDGVVLNHAGESVAVKTPYGDLLCTGASSLASGDRVAVAVRPENISLAAGPLRMEDEGGACNVLVGRVQSVIFLGAALDCRVQVGEQVIRVLAHPSSEVKIDDRVHLVMRPAFCKVVPLDAGGARELEAATSIEPEP